MSTSISKKQTSNEETENLVNIMLGKRFNEILMIGVTIVAVLVILLA